MTTAQANALLFSTGKILILVTNNLEGGFEKAKTCRHAREFCGHVPNANTLENAV
jgi:hypothetical protein